ncbi:NnrS family protein [Oricola nitratireducens]|uniref:NnrS family protein n=1 Tax=Oricola nitratireducens TaxID=2775868 RepID=UPI0018687A44|nr:NnrS family protein [Oricola nitratireducens]
MITSAEKMRAWTGAAILSFGFRPFFLVGAVWAALAMVIWVCLLAGKDLLPTGFDPVSWHAHEMLFGYLGAVIVGFLLTAVPNWTGGLPVVGWPLAGLVGLWIAGRVAMGVSAYLPSLPVALADLALPLALSAFLAREIIAGRNWKNMPVLALLAGWTIANALFHLEEARGGYPAQGIGLRIGLATAVMLISLIGGRIVPSFTRNWLAQRKAVRLPVPFGKADGAVLGLTGLTLTLWVIGPDRPVTAVACGLAGLAHLWRLARWQGVQTGAEALVWVLHAGYVFVPLGFLAIAAGQLAPEMGPAAQHVWMAGAVGLMTLAVMTRASLGHAGRALHATKAITAVYLAVIVSVLARLLAGLMPGESWPLQLAAGAWIAAFGGFAVIYWPILSRPRNAGRQPMRAPNAGE